jgi:hypothetical protein
MKKRIIFNGDLISQGVANVIKSTVSTTNGISGAETRPGRARPRRCVNLADARRGCGAKL